VVQPKSQAKPQVRKAAKPQQSKPRQGKPEKGEEDNQELN
jgi:hypothetical protein